MLTPCLTCSRSRSQPCKPRCAHARIWCSRTCSYAINSPCSPGRRDADRMLGCASGTTCCRSSLVDSAPTGEHLSFVTLETVVRWHRQGWRLFWRWKYRSRGGRPQDLIATMSRDNRLWGTERIRGQFARGRACAPVDHWCASQGTAAHLQGPQVVIENVVVQTGGCRRASITANRARAFAVGVVCACAVPPPVRRCPDPPRSLRRHS